MIYSDRLTPPKTWSPFIRYPSYQPDRRLSILWFLGLAIISLSLGVLALIIVFAVEHSWFYDSFNNNTARYGLWRLCLNQTGACDSWFSVSGSNGNAIEQRLNQARGGINGWQALEIIFLFLTTASVVIALATLVCYRYRRNFHYYLAVLATFCTWLAAIIGVSALFVFGFAVFNVSQSPRDLDWCFYVNLVAVILVLLGAILLSIYDALVRKPVKTVTDDDTVVETFPDLSYYPAPLSPSTFVIVRTNPKHRNKPYSYPQILYPSRYYAPMSGTGTIPHNDINPNYVPPPKNPQLGPYSSIATTQDTTLTTQPSHRKPIKPLPPYPTIEHNRSHLIRSPSATTMEPPLSIPTPVPTYRPTVTPYPYTSGPYQVNQPIAYTTDPPIDYIQRDYYPPPPPRSNYPDRRYETKQEPRVLHYYTGYDYFATIDQSNLPSSRNYPSAARPGSALRYGGNTAYNVSNDYIKTTM